VKPVSMGALSMSASGPSLLPGLVFMVGVIGGGGDAGNDAGTDAGSDAGDAGPSQPADAGAGQPQKLNLSCGCNAAPALAGALLLLTLTLRRRAAPRGSPRSLR
jgi:hypothetical protein